MNLTILSFSVSIPYSTIKITVRYVPVETVKQFQFLIVRLKSEGFQGIPNIV